MSLLLTLGVNRNSFPTNSCQQSRSEAIGPIRGAAKQAPALAYPLSRQASRGVLPSLASDGLTLHIHDVDHFASPSRNSSKAAVGEVLAAGGDVSCSCDLLEHEVANTYFHEQWGLQETLLQTAVGDHLSAGASRLGFGCSALGGRTSRKDSRRILDVAFDAGIRHFDTAPSYGYGASEEILGEFLRDKRDKVTIATKFGIEPPRRSLATNTLRSLMRVAIQVAPGIRSAVSRGANAQVKHLHTVDRSFMHRSLERSLVALGTRYIDLFLMHELELEDSLGLTDPLEDLRSAGSIGRYGCAPSDSVFLQAQHFCNLPGEVVQISWNAFRRRSRERLASGSYTVHSVIQKPLKDLFVRLTNDPTFARSSARALDLDTKDPRVLGRLALYVAMQENLGGQVLFSSLDHDTIRQNAALLHSPAFTAEQSEVFVQLIKDSSTTVAE